MHGLDSLASWQSAAGKPVVACFPLYPPLELLHSMGLDPIVLWGLKQLLASTGKSDEHVQTFSCSIGRHAVEFLLAEAASSIERVFHYNACDTLRNLPEVVAEGLARAGRRSRFFHFHVPMQGLSGDAGRNYFKGEVARLVSSLENDLQERFSPARFKDSVELYREMRRLVVLLQGHVASGRLGFGRYSTVVQSSFRLPVERAIDQLRDLDRESVANPCREGSHRVMVSGILAPPPALSDAIERAGMVVVANDVATLHRSAHFTPRFDGDVGDYYTDFYLQHCPCPTLLYTGDQRVPFLMEMARLARVEGMIFIGEKFCEYEYLEIPIIEARLKQQGMRVLPLEISIDDQDSIAAHINRIDAFAEMLGTREA